MAKIKNQTIVVIGGKEPVLQDKSVEITENTTTTYTADEGFDGLKSLEVTTNIASSGGGEECQEWQVPADMQWAKQALLDDVQGNYTKKVLIMYGDTLPTTDLSDTQYILALKTSDGVFKTKSELSGYTHTWDDTNARVPQNFTEYKKLRWIIFYLDDTVGIYYKFTKASPTLYKIYSGDIYFNYWNENNQYLRGIEFINGAYINTLNSSVATLNSLQWFKYDSFRPSPVLPLDKFPYLQGYDVKTRTGVTSLNGLGTKLQTSFRSNRTLQYFNLEITQDVTDLTNAFQNTPIKKLPQMATSKPTTFSSAFQYSLIESITDEDVDASQLIDMSYAFQYASRLKKVSLNTPLVINFASACNSCYSLEEVRLDLISATTVSYMFNSSPNLRQMYLKNIKKSLSIGAVNNFGDLLTKESLIYNIQQLWDYSGETTTYTLTMGATNTAKLANVYVKLITPTAEQIAEDPYIESKMPCEVCEGTDEGAMLIRDYATLKGWTTA